MSTPIHQRAPQLSEAELHQALEELDAKIQTLRNRAQATVAGSASTHEQHADALETKRAQLAAQLGQHTTEGGDSGMLSSIRHGIESLRDDVRGLLKD
ncbi:hypothetical protein [Hymenobacter properus]|uniref:DUF4164 family protein n=1 Tax=Hymenobacter properus TaxID=2791026 RepID=A0A931BCT5_9BACT|nr:hypothetical protein [Hymenobacter properus]MBF9140929.1 hypothetical protein [Hymenobacter properus]MBR7719738.1 hypothetical protein [Microvirga sp. SRT04]